MRRIALISDTHGDIDSNFYKYITECDELWHAGDIGSIELADKFESMKFFLAVYGNIDDHKLRIRYPEVQRYKCENVDVIMTHNGGYPGKYNKSIKKILENEKPKLFISGHSHILKVMYDKKLELLHMNPGAAGNYGFHTLKTIIRFTIDDKDIKNVEIVEIKRN